MYVDPMLYAAEELANAVIIQAAKDYREAMKDLWLCPRNAKAKYMLEECENFFKSRYFNSILQLMRIRRICRLQSILRSSIKTLR